MERLRSLVLVLILLSVVGGASAEIKYVIQKVYPNGTTPGPQGPPGPTGPAGPAGANGLNGTSVTFLSITALVNGSFLWNFSDGFNYTTPDLRGAAGAAGAAGANGLNGTMWTTNITFPGSPANGDLFLNTSTGVYSQWNGSSWNVRGNLTGPAGPAGSGGNGSGIPGGNGLTLYDASQCEGSCSVYYEVLGT